jgi:hypothetical protein
MLVHHNFKGGGAGPSGSTFMTLASRYGRKVRYLIFGSKVESGRIIRPCSVSALTYGICIRTAVSVEDPGRRVVLCCCGKRG